jgi:hypothetical protein
MLILPPQGMNVSLLNIDLCFGVDVDFVGFLKTSSNSSGVFSPDLTPLFDKVLSSAPVLSDVDLGDDIKGFLSCLLDLLDALCDVDARSFTFSKLSFFCDDELPLSGFGL